MKVWKILQCLENEGLEDITIQCLEDEGLEDITVFGE